MGPKQFHDLVMAFPHTEYATSYGQPAYKAFGKFFTRLRAEDDSVVLGRVSLDEREIICEADPETFHFTDHYRNYPYVLARLKRLDAKTLKGYLGRQWRHNAPRKWLKAWDLKAGDLKAGDLKAGEEGTALPLVQQSTARKTARTRARKTR